MREESRSRADKIELGDELVKILVDSFVEMCQEVPRAKTAREQFLPPVVQAKEITALAHNFERPKFFLSLVLLRPELITIV